MEKKMPNPFAEMPTEIVNPKILTDQLEILDAVCDMKLWDRISVDGVECWFVSLQGEKIRIYARHEESGRGAYFEPLVEGIDVLVVDEGPKLPECSKFVGAGSRCSTCRIRKAMHA